MNVYFLIAAGLSGLNAIAHTFIGGPQLVSPLRKSNDMDAVTRETHYYCWHIVTITLFALACLFLWAAITPSAKEVAIVGTILSGCFCLWGLVLVRSVGQSFRDMPQAFMFLPVAVFGVLGIYV